MSEPDTKSIQFDQNMAALNWWHSELLVLLSDAQRHLPRRVDVRSINAVEVSIATEEATEIASASFWIKDEGGSQRGYYTAQLHSAEGVREPTLTIHHYGKPDSILRREAYSAFPLSIIDEIIALN